MVHGVRWVMVVALLVLLMACANPGFGWATGSWEGDGRWEVRLFHVGNSVEGSWSVDGVAGSLVGSVLADELLLELTRNPGCVILAVLKRVDGGLTGTFLATTECAVATPALPSSGGLQLQRRTAR